MSRILVDQVRSNSASGDAITLDSNGKCAINATTINSLTFPTSDGSANQLLKTDGSGALSFVAPSESNLKHISTTTISSNASEIILANAFNEYPVYKLLMVNIRCTSDNQNMFCRCRDSGGDMTSYHRSRAAHAAGSNFSNWGEWRLIGTSVGNGGEETFCAEFNFSGFPANQTTRYYGLSVYQANDGDPEGEFMNGSCDRTEAVVALKFYWSSGSFGGNNGKFILYGVNNA